MVEATRNGITTRYVYDKRNGNLLAEYDGSNNLLWNYIYGNGLLARVSPTGAIQYYHYNYQGSTIAITDQAQNVVNAYAYDVFGKTTDAIEAGGENRFRFNGKYSVFYETDGLSKMGARYYDDEQGRFISEDPVWHINLYPIADNDPVNYVDPFGTNAFSVTVRVAPVAGGVATVDGPLPFGDAIGAGIVIGGIVIDGILWSKVHGQDYVAKMEAEIANIKSRTDLNKNGVVYALIAENDGYYICHTCSSGNIYLEKGEVWKYGETTNFLSRYTPNQLISWGVSISYLKTGNQLQTKIWEKELIYGYYFEKGHLPPGNKIFR